MSSCEVMFSQMERFSKDNSVTSKLADDLDAKLTTSSKQVLLQRIEFKAASKPDEQYEKLKRKYKPLNCSSSHVNEGFVNNGHDNSSTKHEDLPEPKRVLWSADKVKIQWDKMRRVGPGLSNLGNTCYLNSVLQVLTYTPPLVNFLSTQEHSKECKYALLVSVITVIIEVRPTNCLVLSCRICLHSNINLKNNWCIWSIIN
jgi:hypothetical protein